MKYVALISALILSACPASRHHEAEAPEAWFAYTRCECQAWYSLGAERYDLELVCSGERTLVEHGSYEMGDGLASFAPDWSACERENGYTLGLNFRAADGRIVIRKENLSRKEYDAATEAPTIDCAGDFGDSLDDLHLRSDDATAMGER